MQCRLSRVFIHFINKWQTDSTCWVLVKCVKLLSITLVQMFLMMRKQALFHTYICVDQQGRLRENMCSLCIFQNMQACDEWFICESNIFHSGGCVLQFTPRSIHTLLCERERSVWRFMNISLVLCIRSCYFKSQVLLSGYCVLNRPQNLTTTAIFLRLPSCSTRSALQRSTKNNHWTQKWNDLAKGLTPQPKRVCLCW